MPTLTRPRVAISLGDINGVGIEIALKAHAEISKLITPLYCINSTLLNSAAQLLNVEIPDDFEISETHSILMDEAVPYALSSIEEELDVDLMIVGSISRSLLSDVFIGSTTEKVLDSLDCDVLLLRPDNG